ncbi:MAG: M16 family metallopeptidase, partial [Candidatus Binatia bacterium]
AGEFARKREEALAELEAEEQSPGAVAEREFRKTLFGDGPYRNEPGGWKESVAKLAVSDVKAFFKAAFQPQRTILVASGDTTMREISDYAERLLGGWKRSEPEAAVPPGSPRTSAEVVRVNRDLTQANLVWGHLGTTRDNPDWYAIQVMNYILGGGGFSSRMMNSIRTEAGLAYSVFSYFVPGKLPGSFQVTLQTKSATTADALKRLRKEVDAIRSEPVSDEELRAAKKYLTGSFPMRFDSNGELVAFYSQVEYYGMGLDYPARYEGLINSVSKEDVRRVAEQYLHPERAILVVVGKQADIQLPETSDVAKRR